MEVTTDTATLCVFDTACLAHRKEDVGDWWSLPQNEMEEVNNGNVIFINLDRDGTFNVRVSFYKTGALQKYQLSVKSGRIYVGPAEEVSGGGFEPDGTWGGAFFDAEVGNYICGVSRNGDTIDISLSPGGDGRNQIGSLIRI